MEAKKSMFGSLKLASLSKFLKQLRKVDNLLRTSIFENKHFEDPDGLLPLSVKQMQRLKEWARPIDHIPSSQYVNGMPDIAT